VEGLTVAGVHELVWITSFVSFYFLYPSTFNLLEIAAVEKPKLHMWATGVMRITRWAGAGGDDDNEEEEEEDDDEEEEEAEEEEENEEEDHYDHDDDDDGDDDGDGAVGVTNSTGVRGRHPQMVGQGLWCLAHTAWMGNSFVLVASAFLMLHHLFG
jgi:hypothetical protein